jgi:predicted aconitase
MVDYGNREQGAENAEVIMLGCPHQKVADISKDSKLPAECARI